MYARAKEKENPLFLCFSAEKAKKYLEKVGSYSRSLYLCIIKIKKQTKPYGITDKPNLMTKANALEMIEAMHGNDTCVYTADAQGYNGEYHRVYVDDLLDRCGFEDESWSFSGFSKLTEGEIDVDEF